MLRLRSAPTPPDRDGAVGDRSLQRRPDDGVRWDLVLLWFMRILAFAWIAKGLHSWAVILGVEQPSPPFEARSAGFQAATIYFAIIDLVAAVGLWLASTWGGVMWLLAAMSYLILTLLFPSVVPGSALAVAACVILTIAYLVLSWLATAE